MTNYMEKKFYTDTADYNYNFWNVMRGKNADENKISKGREITTGAFYLPSVSDCKFEKAIKSKSVFRNIANVINAYESSYHINAKHNDDLAVWVAEGGDIPVYDGITDFTPIPLKGYKLATILKMDCDFVRDESFDMEGHIIDRLAKNFARAEDNAFINGDGNQTPTGLLSQTKGAEVAFTTNGITYDDVIRLYFSVKAEYRNDAVWMMNDETALALRTLKDGSGNYLWRNNDDTILGKKVIISEFMPSAEVSKKPIMFGDFSYYWVACRSALSIQMLKEHFAALNQIGYLAFEFMDGKLVRPEAIKVLQIAKTI